jgi:hypothetical protein
MMADAFQGVIHHTRSKHRCGPAVRQEAYNMGEKIMIALCSVLLVLCLAAELFTTSAEPLTSSASVSQGKGGDAAESFRFNAGHRSVGQKCGDCLGYASDVATPNFARTPHGTPCGVSYCHYVVPW